MSFVWISHFKRWWLFAGPALSLVLVLVVVLMLKCLLLWGVLSQLLLGPVLLVVSVVEGVWMVCFFDCCFCTTSVLCLLLLLLLLLLMVIVSVVVSVFLLS